jgi:hypothetical protein
MTGLRAMGRSVYHLIRLNSTPLSRIVFELFMYVMTLLWPGQEICSVLSLVRTAGYFIFPAMNKNKFSFFAISIMVDPKTSLSFFHLPINSLPSGAFEQAVSITETRTTRFFSVMAFPFMVIAACIILNPQQLLSK